MNTLKLFYIKMVFPCHLPLCKVKLTKSEVIAIGLKMPTVAGFKLPTGVICGSRSSASEVLRENQKKGGKNVTKCKTYCAFP